MQVNIERTKGELRVKLCSGLKRGDEDEFFKLTEELKQVHDKDIFFDFSNVRFMTSSIIGNLVQLHKTLLPQEHKVEIRGISTTLHESLKQIALDKVIGIKTLG